MGEPVDGGTGQRRASVATVLHRVEIGIGAVTLVVLFLLVLVQAGQRYLPVEGWAWTGELARFCLVWLTFTVAGALVSSDSHIALQVADMIPREGLVRAVRVFAALMVAVIGAGFAVEAWDLVTSQTRIRSPAMGMPLSWLYVLPLLGFVSTAVRGAVLAVHIARHGVPHDDHDDEEPAGAPGTGEGRA
ncbi:TRAP transporter small permease [Pseudonocardia humida]|uniref:TRAP transporter small permease n=1 Tax=Pseudonocardia humida TaxID=2800819 RepID=A0ABT0ZSW5_9PSEU|nr:TRAP transporter small permease subunit [Pseudonocardia humida]MCO1653778.1 TRAP transporter small permease [Pseudonocardia humida]